VGGEGGRMNEFGCPLWSEKIEKTDESESLVYWYSILYLDIQTT
jgi:hypothetical protein